MKYINKIKIINQDEEMELNEQFNGYMYNEYGYLIIDKFLLAEEIGRDLTKKENLNIDDITSDINLVFEQIKLDLIFEVCDYLDRNGVNYED